MEKKKIKILQFPIANSNGGITHYALENWKWMDKDRFHCDFATMSKHLDFEEEILATGSQIFYISCYAEEDQERFANEFRDILVKGDYDVVHLHTKQWKGFLVEEICKELGVPKVIVHSHNTDVDTVDSAKRHEEIAAHEQIKKRFAENMATDLWACSKAAADFLFGEQIPREKIRIMPNAIDVDKFTFDPHTRKRYREKYGLQDRFVIGHVGRFAYQKNHRFLIKVFREIAKKMDDARLVLLGDGELFSEIQEQVKGYGLADKVIFAGKTDDVAGWYQAMDVFCLPSRFEGLGIVLIEAQTAGLKCITSIDVPEETHITENIVYLPLEVSKWVDAVIGLRTGYLRTDMRSRIREAGYDISKVIKKIEKSYI
ncbi:MAG: glycosyltransferase family 1 protein [Lachnospiraceae bacterium]|nr:glycosyltransferase family 1 protein [Lachnospiraceae bacterium]